MAGYAVSARIERPRLRTGGLVAPGKDRAVVGAGRRERPVPVAPPRPTLAERWEDAQRVWRQTTFYLFDPDSWR